MRCARAPLRARLALFCLALPLAASAAEDADRGGEETAEERAAAADEEGVASDPGERGAESEAGDSAEAEGAADEDAAEAAGAREPLSFTRDGWYAAVAGSFAFDNFAASPFDVDDSFGVNGRIGYRFLEYAGLEFEYERIFKFKLRNPPDGTDFQVNVFTANLRGYAPLWRAGGFLERFHPYALAGIGLHQVDVDDHGAPFGKFGGGEKGAFAARFGGGLDLYLTDQLVLFEEASYLLPVERDNHEMQYVGISFGLQWRFLPEAK